MTESNLFDILNNYRNNETDKVMILGCSDRNMRSLIYEWCRNNGLYSIGCKYSELSDNRMVQCTKCKKIGDESMIYDEGDSWEQCLNCGAFWRPDDFDYYADEGFRGFRYFQSPNAIFLSHHYHALPFCKSKLGRRRTKTYDHTPPEILNEKLSNITEIGYVMGSIESVIPKVTTPQHSLQYTISRLDNSKTK